MRSVIVVPQMAADGREGTVTLKDEPRSSLRNTLGNGFTVGIRRGKARGERRGMYTARKEKGRGQGAERVRRNEFYGRKARRFIGRAES